MSRLVAAVLATVMLGTGYEICEHLPQDLKGLADSLDCGPVPGFYDRPGMIEPAFVYGYVPGPKDSSAAFWCFRSGDKAYLLVTMHGGRLSSHFKWRNFPGGLSLADQEHLPLAQFRYVENPSTPGPTGVRTRYKPLRSEYDGVVELFYRHEGKWLVQMID